MTEISGARLIDFQIMWNRLIGVVEEQAKVLMRTAFSPLVQECGDTSVGVFDLKGRMLAQAVTGTPGHVNSMALSVGHFLRHFPLETMNEGDVFITNDPWMGTGHLNDLVVVTPSFRNGRPVALFASTSHLMDLGGLGFGPDGRDVYMEGLNIPMLRLFDGGRVNETLMAMIRANSRLPIDSEGDTYSLAACNEVGSRRLLDMMEEFGVETIAPLADFICERSRAAVIEKIAQLPKGSWTDSIVFDGYDEPVRLVATVTVSDENIHVDFEGTAAASPFGINTPLTYTTAYTVFGLGCIVAADIPNNAGSLSPLSVSAPLGSILNPQPPAPVACRHLPGHLLPDLVYRCLAQGMPYLVPVEGTGSLWTVNLRGYGDRGKSSETGSFTLSVTCSGGMGASPWGDGLSTTSFPSGVNGTPVEVAEIKAPVVFWKKELRPDSGGRGEKRGGHGQIVEIGSRVGQSFEVLAAFGRIANPPRGRDGGADGAAGYVGLASGRALRGSGLQTIEAGDRLILMTPGGGGLGNLDRRDRDLLEAEVAAGLVSRDMACKVCAALPLVEGEV